MTSIFHKFLKLGFAFACVFSCWAQTPHPEWRALLASPGLDGQPIKAVYFFPGEGDPNEALYTAHPSLGDDQHWNTLPGGRAGIINRMVAAHVNTVIMSYWSNMPQWSPMQLDPNSLAGLIAATQGKPIVILPSIEGGFDSDHPEIPHWEFSNDFPHPPGSNSVAPGLVQRIQMLLTVFGGHMDQWARVYDRDGNWRYAINIMHASSDVAGVTDAQFAAGFEAVARQFPGLPIGFTLDTIQGRSYTAFPKTAGPLLATKASVLAVMGYESEVFSGKVKNGPACGDAAWQTCHPFDNNPTNLVNLADWKKAAVADWVNSGTPVILDVSNGFNGRKVWAKLGTGFWGDNLNYTDDRWRNWLSELKGSGTKGIVMDTWNGYTEGYNAVPTTEHKSTDYLWLSDLFEPDPRVCSHMQYVDGAPTFRVYGAICDKWVQLGADRSFGPPVSNELPSARGRVSNFADGKAIYWSEPTGAHEVHGLIAVAYRMKGADGSCLGLPISDEEPDGPGRRNRFEHGVIRWKPGDPAAQIVCQ